MWGDIFTRKSLNFLSKQVEYILLLLNFSSYYCSIDLINHSEHSEGFALIRAVLLFSKTILSNALRGADELVRMAITQQTVFASFKLGKIYFFHKKDACELTPNKIHCLEGRDCRKFALIFLVYAFIVALTFSCVFQKI